MDDKIEGSKFFKKIIVLNIKIFFFNFVIVYVFFIIRIYIYYLFLIKEEGVESSSVYYLEFIFFLIDYEILEFFR